MAKRIGMLSLLLVLCGSCFAQLPSLGNFYLGYAYNRADTGLYNRGNLNGWEASLEGHLLPFVGLVADYGQNYGTLHIPYVVPAYESGVAASTTRIQTYMVGPRVSFKIGRVRPFAHVLIGAAHAHESSYDLGTFSDTGFADAIGGGIDYNVLPHLAWRLQGDALQTRFHDTRQDNARISTGVVLNF